MCSLPTRIGSQRTLPGAKPLARMTTPLKAVLMNTLSVGAPTARWCISSSEATLAFRAWLSLMPSFPFCSSEFFSGSQWITSLPAHPYPRGMTAVEGQPRLGGKQTGEGSRSYYQRRLPLRHRDRAFAFASLVTTKEIGVGMTVAVLVDATFIRLLLVPATMRLLGRLNWWLPGPPAHAFPVRRPLIGRRTGRRNCRRTPVHIPWVGIFCDAR